MAKRKKRHHKAGRETSHALSIAPGLKTLGEVMLPYLYRWHNRGHRDYEAHVVELLKGFRLSQEVRSVYTDDLIRMCVDSFRALIGGSPEATMDPYDSCIALDMEIQLAVGELVDHRMAAFGEAPVTKGDLIDIASALYKRAQMFHPDLASTLTEEVLMGRATVVAGAYSLFMEMLRAAHGRGGDANENMPAVLYDFWEAKGAAQDLAAKLDSPEEWRDVVVKGVEYVIREAAVDTARHLKRIDAAELEVNLGIALKRLDPRGEIAARLDPRFLGSVAASAIAVSRAGGLDVNPPRKMKKFRGSGEVDAPEVTYRIPQNYWSWNILKLFLDMAEQASRNVSDYRDAFVSSGSNFYLLGEQFLHELDDTDMLIDDLRVMEEAPLPHPSFLWLLPKGYMATQSPGEGYTPVEAMLITHIEDSGGQGIGVDFFNYVPEQKTFSTVTKIYHFDDQGVLACDNADELGSAALQMILKILASMASEPKIVEYEFVESVRPAKKKKRRLEFRVPRVIGWKVRYVKTGSGHRTHTEEGQVAPHWRRRHIRRVPYGPRNVPLLERPRRIVVVARTRVNSEYEEKESA